MRKLTVPFRRLLEPHLNFGERNLKEEFEKAMEKIKNKGKAVKDKKFKMNFNSDDNNKYRKYLIGAAIYFAVAAGVYQVKKERALPLTHLELLQGIKKG